VTVNVGGYRGEGRDVALGGGDVTRTIRLAAGTDGPSCGAAGAAPPASVLPATPTGLVAVSREGTVALDWTDAALASSYRLERRAAGGAFAPLAAVAASAYEDRTVTAGAVYDYRVAGFNASGVSAFSAPVSVTVVAAPPAAPTRLAVFVQGAGGLRADWSDVPGATSYVLERRPTGGAFVPIAFPTQSAQIDAGLAPGATYEYRVAARSAAGTSPYGQVVSGTVLPAAPAGLAITPGPGQAALDWGDVNGATAYVVERRAGGGAFAPVGSPAASAFTNTGLTPATYEFRVAARNSAGLSPYSAVVSGTVPFQLQTTIQAEVDPALAPRITSFSIGVGNPAGISPDQNVILHAPHAGPMPTHWRASDVSAAALQSAPWKVYAPDAPGALFHGPFSSHGRKTVWFQYRAGAAASAVAQDDVEYGWAEYAIGGREAILHAAARGFRFGASKAGGTGTCRQGADWVPLAGYGYDHLYLSEAVAFRQDVGAIVSIVYSELTCEFSFFQGRQLRQGWRTKRVETELVNPPMPEGYPLPSFGASATNVKPLTTASRDASFTVHYKREARTFDLVAGMLLGPARNAFPSTQDFDLVQADEYAHSAYALVRIVLEGPPGADWRDAFLP
jgi:hypothetical protein